MTVRRMREMLSNVYDQRMSEIATCAQSPS